MCDEKDWRNHNWILHHDDAPVHTSLKTTEFVTNNNMVIVPHPPYSPDLAPPRNFALFPKLKMKLNRRRIETMSEIQRLSQAILDSMEGNDFHGAFESWGEGIAVYVPKKTILKEMSARIE
jgi:hypothetical protein